MPKIISYNVNGIRASIKKGLADWIKSTDAEIICLQEIKAKSEQFDEKLFNNTFNIYIQRFFWSVFYNLG
jgi:exodeoxyribonuclease-3